MIQRTQTGSSGVYKGSAKGLATSPFSSLFDCKRKAHAVVVRYDCSTSCAQTDFEQSVSAGNIFHFTFQAVIFRKTVFTAFLKMELKTAVGTSTFIMTFTALIASVSHILIHPAILLEKWDVMLLCIVVATASSLLSARFANRVKNRTVGLATGAVLTVLGGAMLLLNFWQQIPVVPLIVQTLRCLGRLLSYIVPCVLILLPIRFLTKVPSFVFRKLLHIVAFTCFVVMVLSTENWQAAALTSIIIAVLIYPILSLIEGQSWYGKLFIQKSRGEVKRSLLMLFFMFAAVIIVAGGVFGKSHVAAVAILMWGMGDAVAALVGIPFGKHKIRFKPVSGRKSWEGSIAMLVVSLLAGVGLLWLYHSVSPDSVMLPVLVAALMGTIVEMLSPSEWDTVTVPIVILDFLMIMRV